MSAEYWGPASTHEVDGRSNADYLAWVTATFADRKAKLIDALDLKPGQVALDVGCGIGDDVVAMAERVGATGKAIGIDHADAMLDEARARVMGQGLPVDFVKSSIYELPFEDETFNVVRADRVFQHLWEPERAVRELARVTKPGGLISLNDQDADSAVFDLPDRDLYRRIRHALSDHHLANGFAGRSFYRLLKAERFAIELVDAYMVPVLTRELADNVVNATRWGTLAHEFGAITADEADDWLRYLTDLDAAGQFFATGVAFHVIGRKPM